MGMLFNDDPYAPDVDRTTMATAPMGERVDSIGRYKMPLLPGESGPKAGGDWVPGGLMSATNLAGAIVESRQLGIWERERSQMGLAVRPDLYERLAFLINKARLDDECDLSRLNETPAGKAVKRELDLIHNEARQSAGGNLAAQRGTNRHNVWEERAKTGLLFGTPEVNEQIEALEKLLHSKGLERVAGLHERTVRNVELGAAGRFDDVLRTTRGIHMCGTANSPFENCAPMAGCLPAGTLLMADLKTKRRKFYSWIEVRIQLAVYATAEWMLRTGSAQHLGHVGESGGIMYESGPKHHVNQQWGVILWAPSDGAEPQLKRVNLVKGFAHAELARAVVDARSEGKNVAANYEADWPDA